MAASSPFVRQLVADAAALAEAATVLGAQAGSFHVDFAGGFAAAAAPETPRRRSRQLAADAAALAAAATAVATRAGGLHADLAGAEADAVSWAEEIVANSPAARVAGALSAAAAPRPPPPRTKAPPACPPSGCGWPSSSAGASARAPRPAPAVADFWPSEAAQAMLLLAFLGEMRAGDATADRLRAELDGLRTEAARLQATVDAQLEMLDALRRIG